MNQMTLRSRHMIRNSSPGGLRPSMLPLDQNTENQWDSHVPKGFMQQNRLLLWNKV